MEVHYTKEPRRLLAIIKLKWNKSKLSYSRLWYNNNNNNSVYSSKYSI